MPGHSDDHDRPLRTWGRSLSRYDTVILTGTATPLPRTDDMVDFKADIQRDGRLEDRTVSPDRDAAFAAFLALLARTDLDGQRVAARFVVEGRSLYFSWFDQPFGAGRIHPDAPIRPDVDRAEADRLAAWAPRATPLDRTTGLCQFIDGRGWSVTDVQGRRVASADAAAAILEHLDKPRA